MRHEVECLSDGPDTAQINPWVLTTDTTADFFDEMNAHCKVVSEVASRCLTQTV